MQDQGSLSQELHATNLHKCCCFQLALAFYHEATGTGILPAGLQDHHNGSQFFSVTKFLSPKDPKLTPEALQERCRMLQKASEVLKKALSDLVGNTWSESATLHNAAVLDGHGRCSLELGHTRQALKWHQQAQQLRQEVLPDGHILLGHAHLNCGLALAALGVSLKYNFCTSNPLLYIGM
jgi:hypothetical protein